MLCACSKSESGQQEEPFVPVTPPPVFGMMFDAAEIKGMQMSCYMFNTAWKSDASGLDGHYKYSVKQYGEKFRNYKLVGIYVGVDRGGNGLSNDTTKIAKDINNLVWDWYYSKTDFMMEEWNKRNTTDGWPLFFTAYINGNVQLSCDKGLFGQLPGEDLSPHFKVWPANIGCLPIGREKPEMLYGCEDHEQLQSGVPMPDFFKKDTWMQFGYLIGFMDEPTERYDEITFTLTFPASLEHVREFVTSKYKGENAPMRVTDTTFTASFKAKFNWE